MLTKLVGRKLPCNERLNQLIFAGELVNSYQLIMSGHNNKFKSGKYFLIWGLCLIPCGADVIPVLVKECVGDGPELRASECTVFGQHEFNGTVSGHLLKKVGVRFLPAVQCHVDRTVHTWYCGKYSHLHLGAPAVVSSDELISSEDCKRMEEQRVLDIDGRRLPVAFYDRSLTYFINGTILYDDMMTYGIDPQCRGDGIYLNNTFVPNTFQEVQITSYLKNIQISMLPDNSCFLEDQFIGAHCLESDLRLGLDRVIVHNKSQEDRRYFSYFRTVEIVNLTLFTFSNMADDANNQGGQSWLAISPQFSLGLKLGKKVEFSDFLTDLHYFHTNVPDVFLWITTAKKNFFPWMRKKEEDGALLLQLTSSYHQVERILQAEQGCWENNLFHSNIKQVGNLLVQHLGEMELVSVCKKRWLNVTIGANLPCYLGHFSLFMDDRIVAVEPFTRLVKNVSLLMVVECRKNPVFVRVKPGLYLGNKGAGMQLVQTKRLEDSWLKVPLNFEHLLDKGEKGQVLESVEEAKLSELAANSNAFVVEVTEDWFVHLYNSSIDWLTNSWQHFVMAVMGAAGVVVGLLCVGCLGRLCNCVKFSRYRENSN